MKVAFLVSNWNCLPGDIILPCTYVNETKSIFFPFIERRVAIAEPLRLALFFVVIILP